MDGLGVSANILDTFSPDRPARAFHLPGSVRLPDRRKSQGKVSRKYERREEYKLGKVFLLTLGGCLVFQLVPPQIADALQVDRIRWRKEHTKS
jgi:hypothetical protein